MTVLEARDFGAEALGSAQKDQAFDILNLRCAVNIEIRMKIG